MIKAEIVCDSISTAGSRITTFVLTYPRFIHAEVMTHRMLSRNASSSRAIPVKKQIQMVIDNPVIPLAFTKNKAGMQGGEALTGDQHDQAVQVWLKGRDQAVIQAQALADMEVHKQYANRILEPWAHITVVCTGTEWANFFALRCHPAAQPEICELATQMYELYSNGKEPKLLQPGEWHLPFVDQKSAADTEDDTLQFHVLIKRSVARCARVSYLNHDGTKTTSSQDLELYQKLVGAAPIHASPAEHQAMAIPDKNVVSGNFRGWIQYRKTLENENITHFVKLDETKSNSVKSKD